MPSCPVCNGKGFVDMPISPDFPEITHNILCTHCGGFGNIPCEACDGTGKNKQGTAKCDVCDGKGY